MHYNLLTIGTIKTPGNLPAQFLAVVSTGVYLGEFTDRWSGSYPSEGNGTVPLCLFRQSVTRFREPAAAPFSLDRFSLTACRDRDRGCEQRETLYLG